MKGKEKRPTSLSVFELSLFAILGTLMYASKSLMEMFPNIHLLGLFIVSITVVFRAKALFPIYLYILLDGIFSGFSPFWLPYLYIWLPLWGASMLLPQNMPSKIKPLAYMTVSALHGLLFGIMYSPFSSWLFGVKPAPWIIAGFPYDVIHAVSNFGFGILICPFVALLKSAKRYYKK